MAYLDTASGTRQRRRHVVDVKPSEMALEVEPLRANSSAWNEGAPAYRRLDIPVTRAAWDARGRGARLCTSRP